MAKIAWLGLPPKEDPNWSLGSIIGGRNLRRTHGKAKDQSGDQKQMVTPAKSNKRGH